MIRELVCIGMCLCVFDICHTGVLNDFAWSGCLFSYHFGFDGSTTSCLRSIGASENTMDLSNIYAQEKIYLDVAANCLYRSLRSQRTDCYSQIDVLLRRELHISHSLSQWSSDKEYMHVVGSLLINKIYCNLFDQTYVRMRAHKHRTNYIYASRLP